VGHCDLARRADEQRGEIVELKDYIRVIRRRWRLILVVLLVAVAAASFLTVRATPEYSSSARLFISTAQSDSTQAYQGSLFSQQRVTSYADLVTGQELARRVIDDLGLDMTPSDLSSKISATAVPETVILQVSVVDPSPRQAQRLTRAVSEQMISLVNELETPPGKKRAPIKATVVDPANLPANAVSPQPLRNLGLAVILGLLLGVGLAVLREVLDTTVKSPDDASGAAGAPVMGSISFDSSASKRPLISEMDSHAPRVEAFRVLRTNLQFVDVDHDSKVFVVTSSLPGDGKTTTSTNLAITLAQAGERVLLVDGDLRRSKVAEAMNLEPAVGLTTVLVGRIDIEDAVQRTRVPNLSVLTSGAIPPNPSELLQSHAMGEVLKQLRKRYDVVIMDAPPLLPVTDAALLTAQADGCLLVVRHGRTTRDQLRHAIERISAVEGRLLGVVLNMVPARGGPDSYYGYGYGYGPEPGRRKADDRSAGSASDESRGRVRAIR
jgi:capsular exopolysaccharide synthesis family protein